ncbi:hypothetical protein SDC9_193884 [bioreactor metagenome]|uniref:Uncharacterized protein n=1 Tax=bioreactor metagenome TaxID=1076179 RepID=A0A645I4W4_9ZZZZ
MGSDRQKKIEGNAKLVKAAKGELDSDISNYNGALNYINARDRWTKVMMELEKVLPDTMWVTYVEPFDNKTISSMKSNQIMAGGMPGMPVMGMPPEAMMMGGAKVQEVSGVTLAPSSLIKKMDDVEWIVIEGHAMELGDNLPEAELQRNLSNSEVFAGGGDEDFVRDYRKATEGEMNLTSFRFRLKLKEPIEQQ